MTTTLKIDFVSDIACPWCAVGLGALEQALDSLQGEVKADIRFSLLNSTQTWLKVAKTCLNI